MGRYGIGPYGRWGGNTFDVAGASSIHFAVQAPLPQGIHQLLAATGITFSAQIVGVQRTIQPAASTQIVFSISAHMALTWEAWAPCELGAWQSPAPCEGGAWQAPGACSVGVWKEAPLI